jgi:type II secretory pathway component PulF
MNALSFDFIAVDSAGLRRRGNVDAADNREAYRKVSAQGLTPVRISRRTCARSDADTPCSSSGLRRLLGSSVKRREVAQFTYQLSVLMEARLPVVECFTSIAEQEENPRLKAILMEAAHDIEAGQSVTGSLERHRAVFGDVFIETVRAAERSGNMITVLAHLAEMIEDEAEMTRVVRGAMIYPICVLTAIMLAVLFLVTSVVPRFATMFADRGVDLPPLTVGLMILGTSIKAYWWAYLGTVFGAGLALKLTWNNTAGRRALDRALHAVPQLRNILVGLAVGRFTGVFGVCLRSGLPLIESLELGGRASGRPLLRRDVDTLVDQVRQGGRLGDVLATCPYFPAFVRQLLRAGETSAELPRMCQLIARNYARETRHLAKTISKVIEPVTIAGLTVVVLVISLGVFLPMWDMVKIVG